MAKVEIEFTPSKESPEVAILTFSGELDSGSIAQIGRSFDLMLEGNYLFAVADMARVTLISSAALGELMGCRTRLLERGGDLVFAGLGIGIREKLTAMDANKVFKFFSDVRSAMNAYNWEYHDRSEGLELSFPSLLKFVPPVRQFASRIARQKGYGNRDSFRIETIVDEICNNAVEHGVEADGGDIDLNMKIDRKKIEIKVSNTSDPDKIDSLKEISKSLFVPQMLTEESKRGRGLALVKMLSNDFEIEYSDIGTCVHVTKLREE
ncbi:MAG: STAS domain-containing protein [Chitinivibrionales bacterium]|nr:STAS domain-containing protein [Chitinivibrionales bacterium]MBD3394295.1 STAS domain-containing protein [Chitinivibrionales bacterium]